MRPTLAALTLLLVAAAPAGAPAAQTAGLLVVEPDTVRLVPGEALDTSWLAPGETTYTIRVVEPMRQDVGTAVERVSVSGGVATRVVRLRVAAMGNRSQTDSLRADAATLAPLTHHSSGGRKAISLEFSPEGVVGLVDSEPVVMPLDAPLFDGAWIGEIAQSLPLVDGRTVAVPAFDGERGEVAYTLSMAAPEGDATAWTVTATSPSGPTATYLIDGATRRLLRTRFSPQPGVTVELVPQP